MLSNAEATAAATVWHPLLKGGRIFLGLRSTDKASILDEILTLAKASGFLPEGSTARAAVLAREALMSTGMCDGMALPHGRCPEATELLSFLGVSERPVAFGSLDGLGSQLFVLTLFPESLTGAYLSYIADIGRLLEVPANRAALLAAQDSEEVEDLLGRNSSFFCR